MEENEETTVAGTEGADESQETETTEEGAEDTHENDGADEAEGGEDGEDKGGGKEAAGDKPAADKKPTPKAPEEPQTRKRNADFIIQRKANKAAKAENKGGGADDQQGQDDVDNEDIEVIDGRIKEYVAPLLERVQAEEDQKEISDFVSANPDFEPYKNTVAAWAKHPSRREMPIKAIFYEVAGDDLIKIGANRQKAADKKAKETTAGGGANRSQDGGAKPVWEQTPEEFQQAQNAVRNKQAD